MNLFSNGRDSYSNWEYDTSVEDHANNKTAYVTDVAVVRADKRKRLVLSGSNVLYDLLTPNMNRKLEIMHMQCKQWSTCCGGGGLEAGDPDLCERLGLRRVEELLNTGANVIVSHCPACVMQLRRSAVKMKADVKVMDLVEILDEALE